jgi:BirA family transcriptional regulator, biotin operon repressor / biotin---[acetyl-CoA-carboxylase] ligase
MFGFEVLQFSNPFNRADLYYRYQTGSTMEDAERFALHGVESGTVITAGFQSSGRGRMKGREWLSEAGKNLLFTLLIKRKELNIALNLVPLMAGCSVSSIMEEQFKLPSEIKWPNDVLINEKKIAGILCSVCDEYVLIGIGINCNQLLFPGTTSREACSISGETGREVDLHKLLSLVLGRIQSNIHNTIWLSLLHQRLYRIGEAIRFVPGDPEKEKAICGVLRGVDANGCLILYEEKQGKKLYFASGEIR